MPIFSRAQNATSSLGRAIRQHPGYFGAPFLLIIVGASFGLTGFTQVRYDVQDGKQKQVAHETSLGLTDRKRKVDIREEYFRLQSAASNDWEIVRVPRPKGVPEWGMPPTEARREEPEPVRKV